MTRRVHYDFHLHSCLSPCGDNDATPASIAGFARLCGLDVAALTDHNTCANCASFFEACERYGVVPIAGMELTTAEDIHLVCLFETLEQAKAFDAEIAKRRVLIKNRPQFFGRQLIADADDGIIGEEEHLLSNATTLALEDAFELATSMSAVCYPAHVDRESNGIIAVLGAFPDKPPFAHAEFRDVKSIPEYCEKYPPLRALTRLFGSDAHRLCDIPEAGAALDIEGEDIRAGIFRLLRGGQ